ncbi:hypothetical protein GCM10023200_24080 [Actinomycetospora chlora]|uniref:Uncharacterized protein n=1 Tax=Actinomycetospora chlora TaxID=663608 RepID=A0ABP9B045_9PSEU
MWGAPNSAPVGVRPVIDATETYTAIRETTCRTTAASHHPTDLVTSGGRDGRGEDAVADVAGPSNDPDGLGLLIGDVPPCSGWPGGSAVLPNLGGPGGDLCCASTPTR